MKSRYRAMVMIGVMVLFLAMLFVILGYENAWHLWNIPTLEPHFGDLRTITHCGESIDQGLDPMVENPGDPWNRNLNYPRIWQSLHWLGIKPGHTTVLGISIITSFLIGVVLILPGANRRILVFVSAALLSPATLLCIERANIDLVAFFFIAISIVMVQASYITAGIAVFLGFILKLFPIFGWAVLVKAGKSRFLIITAVLLAIVGIYCWVMHSDLVLIVQGTPQGTRLSYGMNVFWMKYADKHHILGLVLKYLSYGGASLVLGFSISALLKNNPSPTEETDPVFLDSFRAGAAIYVGTFILGNNWDYRLIFLVFTIPQLVSWTATSSPSTIAKVSKMALYAIYLSLWYLVLSVLLKGRISFVVDEAANWGVFACLFYLTCLSAPSWVKADTRKILSRLRRSS